MKSQDMQVIGLCRFSYPAIGGFQVEHDTVEARMAYLYAPERIEERFRAFQAFTLPALRAQTDKDFTFLVVIGDAMPALYRDRLQALLADVPQAVIQAHPPGPHRAVMKTAINSVRDARPLPCLQFRMDDDDAVGIRFVARLRAVVDDLGDELNAHRHVAIDFTHGWVARPGPDGIGAQHTVERLWTPALAMSSAPGVANTIMNFGHARLARHMPVIEIDDEDMFLRGHSDRNDSRQKDSAHPVHLTPLTPAQEDHFRATYAIDADQVRALFA